MTTVTFKTATQAAIFDYELKGQISDGFWENTPNTGWDQWCGTDVLVGDDIGRDFWARKDNFNFAHKDLVDIVGERMKTYAKLALAGIPHSEIRKLADGCTNLNGEFSGPPVYEGEFWDKRREYLRRWNLEWVKEVLDSYPYTDKDLQEDLKAIKVAVRVHK